MKNTGTNLLRFIGIGYTGALISCAAPNQEVITTSLRDNLIAVAKDARAAGASQLKYTAHVIDASDGSAAVVVPVAPPVTLGASRAREVGTTVEITIDIPHAANQTPAGDRFLINPQTLRTRRLPDS